jgi:thiosulfate/3-mercaptopyruvate sulfurtransferase
MTTSTLISAEALAARLDEPRLRIFDCRFDLARPAAGRAQYHVDHLPRAVYADLNDDLSAPVTARSGRHPLPPPTIAEARLRARGLNCDSRVVAYDDGNGMYAARLWWMLRWLGHDDVAVLDGGMRRWRELGLPVEQAVPATTPGNFVARLRDDCAVDATAVMDATGDAGVRILDARAPERYRGEVEPIDAVAGHVPGARNHPFTLSLGADGRFLPPDELRSRFLASLDGVAASWMIAM